MDKLEKDKDALESKLSKASSAFKESRDRLYVNKDRVCEQLSQGSALVEFVEFWNYIEEKEWLIAFIVEQGRCESPFMLSLGPAEDVEKAVRAWREELERRLRRR